VWCRWLRHGAGRGADRQRRRAHFIIVDRLRHSYIGNAAMLLSTSRSDSRDWLSRLRLAARALLKGAPSRVFLGCGGAIALSDDYTAAPCLGEERW